MGGGLENRCVGRVYGLESAVPCRAVRQPSNLTVQEIK